MGRSVWAQGISAVYIGLQALHPRLQPAEPLVHVAAALETE